MKYLEEFCLSCNVQKNCLVHILGIVKNDNMKLLDVV